MRLLISFLEFGGKGSKSENSCFVFICQIANTTRLLDSLHHKTTIAMKVKLYTEVSFMLKMFSPKMYRC